MATLKNKRKLAAVTRDTQEEHPWNGQSRNTSVSRINEEYITQISVEIEGRVTKKLSEEFSRTESRILCVLSELDETHLNPQIRTHSGTVPGILWNTNVENQGTNEGDSRSDPHPEAGILRSQTTQNSGPEVGHEMMTRVQKQKLCGNDMVTRAQKVSLCGHDMVTGVQEEIPNRPHIRTGIQEDIPYCPLGTSSGKQKEVRATSQPPFRSDNIPATIEADQSLLALQQLASNSNSVNINNSINKISKLPKSLTTTMPTFDGKSEKFELFEGLFQTSFKTNNQLTEEDKIKYFQSLMRSDALQTLKNISSRNRETLAEILTVFRSLQSSKLEVN